LKRWEGRNQEKANPKIRNSLHIACVMRQDQQKSRCFWVVRRSANILRASTDLSKMRPKIYLYGDSITEESFSDGGWGASLSHHFSRTVIIYFFLSYYLSYCIYIFLSLCFLIMFGSLFFFQVDVVLRGYSGYNTRWALKVAERIFPPVESGGVPPLAVTVFFGANDACLPDRYSAFQHVPLHEYKQNLHSIISFFKVYMLLTILSGF